MDKFSNKENLYKDKLYRLKRTGGEATLFGEQPIGTSIMVPIPNTDKKLIHTPTMRLPSPIKEPLIIYQCMRTTMMMAVSNKIHSIVIPAFGGST